MTLKAEDFVLGGRYRYPDFVMTGNDWVIEVEGIADLDGAYTELTVRYCGVPPTHESRWLDQSTTMIVAKGEQVPHWVRDELIIDEVDDITDLLVEPANVRP